MTNRNGHSASKATLDNDAFINAAKVGDTVEENGTTHTVVQKHYSESNDIVVRYFVKIVLDNNISYTTLQSMSAREYLTSLAPGDRVEIKSTIYEVINKEFSKDAQGAQITRVNWRPAA
jgi:translation elongation factor P/translation initiation factor 5A